MKNLYLSFAGILMLASGIQLINKPQDEAIQQTKIVARPKHDTETRAKHAVGTTAPAIGFVRQNKAQSLVPALSATNVYRITNDTGPSGPSANDELEYTVTISNSGTSASSPLFSEQIDQNTTLVAGSLKVSPIAQDDAYASIGNVGIKIEERDGLFKNDINPGSSPLRIVGSLPIYSANGGRLEVDRNTGGFRYFPAAGFAGVDSFTYTIENGSGFTDQATVSITIQGMIWFILDSELDWPAGTGTLTRPFNSIQAFQAINDDGALHAKRGHTIFLFSGNHTGSIRLLTDQKLVGQGAGSPLVNIAGYGVPFGTPQPPARPTRDRFHLPGTGSTKPVLTGTGEGNVVTVATGNTIQGMDVGDSGKWAKIAGQNIGNLDISFVGMIGNGSALDIANGRLTAAFHEIQSAVTEGDIPPIRMRSISGSVMIEYYNSAISSVNVPAIDIQGTSLVFEAYIPSVSASNASKGISISGVTGPLTIFGNGTPGSAGVMRDITQRGIELINTSDIQLEDIDLINANTGEGTLPSALDNSNANAAFYANNVRNLSLKNIRISGTVVQEGINFRGVSNFTLNNVTVGKSGSQTTSEEGCLYAINTSGTNSIINSTFDDPGGRVAYFSNNNTNMDLLTISGSTFSNADNGPGIQVEGREIRRCS